MTAAVSRSAAAAALVLGAAALGACGSSGGAGTDARAPGGIVVSLNLRGEQGHEQLLACSIVHRYAVFAARRLIAYDGAVRPAPDGRWKVKVKIKRCVDGRFQESGADRVVGAPGGRFAGQLQPPGKGVFFARVRYRSPAGDVVSDKVYFEVR